MNALTDQDLVELTQIRRDLHCFPDISGAEAATAARIAAYLTPLKPDSIVTGLGGHGVAAVFGTSGPSVMFRAELDGLPIAEISDAPHRSAISGQGHLCGHDGHMTILLGLGRLIARARPKTGRVVLMFQPAEETGAGARAVACDPKYEGLRPDWAFAIHNMPRWPLGMAQCREGTVNYASLGLRIMLLGKTAHASLPETGLSPALAIAQIIPALMSLPNGGELGDEFQLVTITHAQMGAPAFGIAPGAGEVWATLRCAMDSSLADLTARAQARVQDIAASFGLQTRFEIHDPFDASVNHPAAVGVLNAALGDLGMAVSDHDLPMRASEDFGAFGGNGTRSAMLFLGAGTDCPDLHNPDYDFPDALLPIGVAVFYKVLQNILDMPH